MIGYLRRFFRRIFGRNSGCCKIPNGSRTSNVSQKSYGVQQSY